MKNPSDLTKYELAFRLAGGCYQHAINQLMRLTKGELVAMWNMSKRAK